MRKVAVFMTVSANAIYTIIAANSHRHCFDDRIYTRVIAGLHAGLQGPNFESRRPEKWYNGSVCTGYFAIIEYTRSIHDHNRGCTQVATAAQVVLQGPNFEFATTRKAVPRDQILRTRIPISGILWIEDTRLSLSQKGRFTQRTSFETSIKRSTLTS